MTHFLHMSLCWPHVYFDIWFHFEFFFSYMILPRLCVMFTVFNVYRFFCFFFLLMWFPPLMLTPCLRRWLSDSFDSKCHVWQNNTFIFPFISLNGNSFLHVTVWLRRSIPVHVRSLHAMWSVLQLSNESPALVWFIYGHSVRQFGRR